MRALLDFILPGTASTTPVVTALWPRRLHPNPAKHHHTTSEWQRLKHVLGVRPELHIHDLRRHAAEGMWSATHDLRKVQAFLGHRTITATARYLANRVTLEELTPDVLRAVKHKQAKLRLSAEKLSPPPKEVQ